MQGMYEGYALCPDREEAMKHLKSTSDVYSPWGDADLVSEKTLPRNSDTIPEDQDCRSYTPHVVREGLTEIEFKLKCLMGIEVTYTVPRSIFQRHL